MHNENGHAENKFDAVVRELDVAIDLLKESCGEEQALFIEESIYQVLVDLVTTIVPGTQNGNGMMLNLPFNNKYFRSNLTSVL